MKNPTPKDRRTDPIPTPASAPLSHREILSILMGLMLAMLLAALDQTIVATAMPTIGKALGDFQNLPWVVTAYLLTSTAVTPLYGKLSDIHGRRIMLLVAVVIFSLGSLLCALSPSLLVLVFARGLQGVGGGGLIALAQTIIADMVSPKERGRYQGYIASVFVTSSLAGPLLGGFFAEHLHWSLIFWINLPLGLAAFLMTNEKLKRLPRHERPQRLDILGAALLMAATISLLLALSWGGVHYPWASREILAVLLISSLFWIGFILRLVWAANPLIPLAILNNQVVATGTLAACFAMGTFIGLTIYTPIYLEGVLGFSASQSGVALIPLMIGTVTGATIAGRLMIHLKHYKWPPMLGLACSVAAIWFLALYPQGLGLIGLEILLAVISLGLGSVLPVTTVAIQNAVAFHELGTATASMNFFRSLGGAILVAIFGTLVLGGVNGAHSPDITALTALEKRDLGQNFQYVFAAAGLGLLLALGFLAMMRELPLRDRHSKPAGGND